MHFEVSIGGERDRAKRTGMFLGTVQVLLVCGLACMPSAVLCAAYKD